MMVRWTPNGSKAYEYIMTCATSFYGKPLLRKLVRDIKKAESNLADNPMLGCLEPLAEGQNFEYRRLILVKPFKLIYTIYDNVVYIADIWDMRQCPDTLAQRLQDDKG